MVLFHTKIHKQTETTGRLERISSSTKNTNPACRYCICVVVVVVAVTLLVGRPGGLPGPRLSNDQKKKKKNAQTNQFKQIGGSISPRHPS